MKAKNKLIKRIRKTALQHPSVSAVSVEYSPDTSDVLVIACMGRPGQEKAWDELYSQLVIPYAEEASNLGVIIGIE